MTKRNKPGEQGDALTPRAIANMRELGITEAKIEELRLLAERERAAGGFKNLVVACEAARIASEARGYAVQPEDFTVTVHGTARDSLDAAIARGAPGGNIGWWASLFACELAAQREKEMPDPGTYIEYENALAAAARAGQLTMRPPRAPAFVEAVTPDTTDKRLKNGLVVLRADMRAYAEQHAPGLLGSALLAEPTDQESAPAACSTDAQASPSDSPSAPVLAHFSKSEIATAFDGIWKTSAQWVKYLGDTPPKWLQAAVAQAAGPGNKVGRLWNPVEFAMALKKRKPAIEADIKRAFWKKSKLEPWRIEWNKRTSPFDQY